MTAGRPSRMVLLCGLAVILFSALFSLAAWYDWWPRLPPGALHDTDLWAGVIGGIALLALLLRSGSLKVESPESRVESPKEQLNGGPSPF